MLDVERCRTTVHNWVQKADLQPLDGANPDHVTVDDTVIQLNDERFWLYVAVDPHTNRLLHFKHSPTRNQAIIEMFLSELRDKHLVDDAIFLVDSAQWLQAALHQHSLDYRYEKHGNRNRVKCVFRELKRRTNQF
jgi:transposase-like protein